jgi:hypothetical protein
MSPVGDVDDGRLGVEDSLGGGDDRWMSEAGLTSLGSAQIEIDDITRGRLTGRLCHRIRRSTTCAVTQIRR